MTSSALNRRAREARDWMTEACLPLWAREGIGPHGLFREALDLSHKAVEAETARVRVQARQTYVFCLGRDMGWDRDRAEHFVQMGVRALKGPCLRADGLAGRVLDTDGSGLSDARADLYDTAFTLFALAHASKSGEESALPAARGILKAVDTMLADPDHGGYAEMLPRGSRRQQNPHMHLLEACHALHSVDPESGHLARAERIVSLFTEKMLDPYTSTLGEHFRPDWSEETGETHEIVEPGHQFEWVWLLKSHAGLTGDDLHPAIAGLYDFGCRTLDEDGRVFTAAQRSGTVTDASRRTWMQTEALKAHLAMHEIDPDEEAHDRRAVQCFDILMDEYLTPEGGWIDRFDEDGQVATENMPASTGYHVGLAFDELIRVTGV
ncbi:AGE family epimerase/isomerase [Henriciella sp.]|uniref:AGE family epimerase/isomerase n=1 Tax=Henriciella sp. TaxID=1968823 RepID=UPI002612F954|nr:AGE family epimerase/isomerase [Henriciella sp.]